VSVDSQVFVFLAFDNLGVWCCSAAKSSEAPKSRSPKVHVLACAQLCSQLQVLRVPAWRFYTNCTGALEGEGLSEGLRGREGWGSILLGCAGWIHSPGSGVTLLLRLGATVSTVGGDILGMQPVSGSLL
jgi:hypothetical protein